MAFNHAAELQRLLEHPEEVVAVELLPYAQMLPVDPFHLSLMPPTPGLYMPGTIEPILRFDRTYYYQNEAYGRKAFSNIGELVDSKCDIRNSDGDIVIKAQLFSKLRRLLRLEPTVPAMAIKTAVAVVVDMLNNLRPETAVPVNGYRLRDLVRPDYQKLVEDERFEMAYESLLEDVIRPFVGRNTWFIYSYRLTGTAILIEKVCDWRVYQYHRQLAEQDLAYQDCIDEGLTS